MKYIFSLLLLFVITILTLVASSLIGSVIICAIYDIPFTEFNNIIGNMTEYPELRTAILLLQGLATQVFGLLAAALFFTTFVYRFNKTKPDSGVAHVMNPKLAQHFFEEPFLRRYRTPLLIFAAVFVLIIVVFPIVQLTGALNGAIELPDYFQALEVWMKALEESALRQTLYMTDFSSISQTILGFIVIAVLAGLCEEIYFRGVVQPIFQNLTKNKHVAIWITAIIFSAIHFQFYGFIPRMLLGALFGYLYIYTNNIFIPIWAHILNNGLTLIMVLFVDKEMLNTPKMEANDFVTMIPLGILSLLLCIGILRFIKKKMEKEVEENMK